MTPEKWQEVWRVFDAAMELPPDQRRDYIRTNLPDREMAVKAIQTLDEMESPAESDSIDGWASQDGAVREAPADQLKSGDTVGRFVVTRLLGRGGMGEVYAANDPELHREVALKLFAASNLGSRGTVERFIKEARAASALNHPGIVTIYEVVRSDPTVAIVMEVIEGSSLRKVTLPQSVRQVAVWGRQIAEALAAAHRRGIMHRDIKPENLMVRSDGYVKVLDFGLAREVSRDRSSVEGVHSGTLRYMSPEQIRGDKLTTATDVFSLGLVLHELVTGVHPFDHQSPFETAHLILTAQPAPPSASVAKTSLNFDSLIARMLDKDPRARPNAAEVAEILESIVEESRTGASSTTAIPSARKPVGRLRSLGIAAGCMLGVVLAGIAWTRLGPGSAPATSDVKLVPLHAEPLTSSPGRESNPAFSPDGRQIAYSWDGGRTNGNRNIYVKLVGAGNPLQLTRGSREEGHPVWSPDTTRIAFLRYSDTKEDRAEVVVVPALGGAEHVVGTMADPRLSYRRTMIWSPDPDELIIADTRDATTPGLAFRLFGLRISTGARRPLTTPPDGTSDLAPLPSPDGRFLAFLRELPFHAWEIWLLRWTGADGAAESPSRRLQYKGAIRGFAWDADSRSIVYAASHTAGEQFWRVGIDSSGRAATQIPYSLASAAWEFTTSPQRHQMAYVNRQGDRNVWARAEGRDRSFRPLITSTRNDEDARISPDGKRVVFSSNRSGKYEIWVCDIDGANPHPVTAQGVFAGSASWSPDGRTIAYDSVAGGMTEIWLVNADGGAKPRKLLDPPRGGIVPNWSADGAWVYFNSNSQIWKAPSTGGSVPVQVTRNGGFEGVESPDGKYLYFQKDATDRGIWRMPLPEGQEELVPELRSIRPQRHWAMTTHGIYFADWETAPVLKLYRFSNRTVTTAGPLPRVPISGERGLSVSSDGRTWLFLQLDTTHEEIMLVDGFR